MKIILKLERTCLESSWSRSCWICVFESWSEQATGSWASSHSTDTQWCLLKPVFFIDSVFRAICIYVPGFCLQLLGHILTFFYATDNVETCVCFVLSWCFLVNRNKKLLVLTAGKVNSVAQGQQAGDSSLLKGVLHQMLPSLFSVQSSPLLLSGRRSCWLALGSLIAFDRGVVALFSCRAGFLHVLYNPKAEQPGWRCSEFHRSGCVTAKAWSSCWQCHVWRECRKRCGSKVLGEWKKRKQVSGLEVRTERSRNTLLELVAGIHLHKVWVHLPRVSIRGKEYLNTVFNITLFFLHWKQFLLMG